MDARYSGDAVKHFPITALVGHEKTVQALAFALLSPDIRTVLICGPSGTGKSVAARAVIGMKPGIRLVEVPTGVTMEQLLGSVDMETAIREGRREASDSILRRADGGVLIADNINLLDPDLLHTLLNSVQEMEVQEMGGFSAPYRCDTLLIGTMDPGEGELDEHILDRFDICVYTDGCAFPEDRREIVIRVLRYERDPFGLMSEFSAAEDDVRRRIVDSCYDSVEVPDGFPSMIAEICERMHTEGHRGDISVLNVLRASSAYEMRDVATVDDLKRAVFLCLQHRRHDAAPPPDENDPPPSESPDESDRTEQDDSSGNSSQQKSDGQSGSDGDGQTDYEGKENGASSGEASERTFGIGEQFKVANYIPPEGRNSRNRRSGRQDTSKSKDRFGRKVGYIIPKGKVDDISLIASILTAAPYQPYREHNGLAIVLRSEDLRENVRVRRKGTTVLFVVDGSGSMGAHNRMVAVKGAILSMLNDAYQRRDKVGLVVFRGDSAEVILPPTRSVLTAYRALADLPTGGRTPLVEGLRSGYEVLRRDAESRLEPVMVVLTDGKGNVKGGGFNTAEEAIRSTAEVISEVPMRTIVVDTESGLVRFGKARDLASMMGSAYIVLEDLNAEMLSASVKVAMGLFE